MTYTTDPAEREEFIASLRAVADYLATHPAIPVPPYGHNISVHADATEYDGKQQVKRIAKLLRVKVVDETRTGGHYLAWRTFGCINYEIVSIPEANMAQYDADMSYRGCVIPDSAA
jgi:hypothetical protein